MPNMPSTVIGIDTGNRCIKTANNIFVAGVKEISPTAAFYEETISLKMQDSASVDKPVTKCYALTEHRSNFLADKTENNDYFILSLFGIAKELISRNLITNSKYEGHITLGVGLPPRDLARLKSKFTEYFNRGEISFVYKAKSAVISITVSFDSIRVFPQGFSAVAGCFSTIKTYHKVFIIDIGGYTTDIIEMKKGTVDPAFCTSLNFGMIPLFNIILQKIETETGARLDEGQIDLLLSNAVNLLPSVNDQKPLAHNCAKEYVEQIICKLNELGIDLKNNNSIFVGGGSQRLKSYIEESPKTNTPFFISDIHANAVGYECMINAVMRMKAGIS